MCVGRGGGGGEGGGVLGEEGWWYVCVGKKGVRISYSH